MEVLVGLTKMGRELRKRDSKNKKPKFHCICTQECEILKAVMFEKAVIKTVLA
jgi:hypothetical protein